MENKKLIEKIKQMEKNLEINKIKNRKKRWAQQITPSNCWEKWKK